MSYLGLDLENLTWELKALIKNNYGSFNLEVIEDNFENAKESILETFKDIIEQNKQDVLNELKEDLKEAEENE